MEALRTVAHLETTDLFLPGPLNAEEFQASRRGSVATTKKPGFSIGPKPASQLISAVDSPGLDFKELVPSEAAACETKGTDMLDLLG